MTHPSEHILDRIASGLPPVPAAAAAHLLACEACAARLESIRREADSARNLPGYAAGLAAMRRAESARRPRRFSLGLLGGALAAAAAVLLSVLVLRPGAAPSPDTRTKGASALALVAAGDEQPLDRTLVAGEAVQLVVNPGQGSTFALVFMVDQRGEVSILWPPLAARSARVPDGSPLEPGLRVTTGDFLLFGVFSAKPLEAAPLLDALALAAKACAATTAPPCLPLDILPGESHRARATFRVESPP